MRTLLEVQFLRDLGNVHFQLVVLINYFQMKKLVLILSIGFLFLIVYLAIGSPSKREITIGNIVRISGAVQQFAIEEGRIPKSLDELTERRPDMIPSVTDGWGRKLNYSNDGDKTLTIASFGSDGEPGGTEHFEDIFIQLELRDRDGNFLPESEDWLIESIMSDAASWRVKRVQE